MAATLTQTSRRGHNCHAESNEQLLSHDWKERGAKPVVVSTYRCRKCGTRWETGPDEE